jgi:hypothetical protein
MKYSSDILQQIEDIVGPIENALKTMQEHKNIKPITLEKIQHNLETLRYFKQHALSKFMKTAFLNVF